MAGEGLVGDVVVQAGRERAAAQGLQQMAPGLGEDVTSSAARAVSSSGRTPARITAAAGRQRSSRPAIIALPNFRIADAPPHQQLFQRTGGLLVRAGVATAPVVRTR
ncbi:hypothetical protein [Streptomyces amakusaensis]|uniref:Uncharacterized protein n=1 Tax=Streptomyces amakusaensis TaxID=67271 RepID=A0ABW0AR17_9ACTN